MFDQHVEEYLAIQWLNECALVDADFIPEANWTWETVQPTAEIEIDWEF